MDNESKTSKLEPVLQNVTTNDRKLDTIEKHAYDEKHIEETYKKLPLPWVKSMLESSKEFFVFFEDNQVLIANGIKHISTGPQQVGTVAVATPQWITFSMPRYREFTGRDKPDDNKGQLINEYTPNQEYSVPVNWITGVLQKECGHNGWMHHETCGDCGEPIDDLIRIAQGEVKKSKRFVDELDKREKAHMATTPVYDFDKDNYKLEIDNIHIGDMVCIVVGCLELVDVKVNAVDTLQKRIQVSMPKEHHGSYSARHWFEFENVTAHCYGPHRTMDVNTSDMSEIVHDKTDPYSITIQDIDPNDRVTVPTPDTRHLATDKRDYSTYKVVRINQAEGWVQIEHDREIVTYDLSDIIKLIKDGESDEAPESSAQ